MMLIHSGRLSFWVRWYVIAAILVVQVSSSNTSCPTWFYYDKVTQQCKCGPTLVECNQQERIAWTVCGYCVTYSGKEGQYYTGKCPFRLRTNSTDRIFIELPTHPDQLNGAMCGPYYRKGLFCGRCIDGHGPAVYSYDLKCTNCSAHSLGSGVGWYLLLEFIPITLFFLFVVIFRLNITSGPLLGYVLFCQVYTFIIDKNMFIYDYILSELNGGLKILLQTSIVLCETLNLHFLKLVIPSFCISEKLSNVHIQLLSLVTVTYPVVLVIITFILIELHARNYRIVHILWSPFSFILKKINITTVTSDAVFHAFASCIFISSTNIVYVLFALTEMTNLKLVVNSTVSSYRNTLYIDPTVVYWSSDHILYLLIAAIPTFFLVFIPSVLLCVYPTKMYGYLSQCISSRKRLAITAFVEALHNCFKDGLNGSRDYRALAGVFIVAVPVYTLTTYLVWYMVTQNYRRNLASGYIFLILSLLILKGRPCKSLIASLSLSYHSAALGVIMLGVDFWTAEPSIHTRSLELKFIFIPLISHTLIFTWAGYTIVNYVWRKFGCHLTSSPFMLDALRGYFRRDNGGYQEIPEVASS